MKSFNDFIIDTRVLKSNAINIKKQIGKDVKLCAVVKADAYGLGARAICSTIAGIVDFFAVASVCEGINIRVFDKTTKIVVLGVCSVDDIGIACENNISISVSNLQKLYEICKFCSENELNCNIHLQVNSGLNRYGFCKISEFVKALKIIELCDYVNLEGVYSHFATKSQDIRFIKKQYLRFLQYKKYIKNKHIICHIANSFATTYDSKFALNMVRNGFLLYGGTHNTIGNKLVLTIKSQIVNVLEVGKGSSIGYDRTFVAKKRMKIAVVPMGYADGMDRRLSNGFKVLISGQKCPIVGLICMDVFMVDISNVNAKIGDSVVILGTQGDHKITLDDFAKKMNTSPYEVLLHFNYKRMNYVVK